MPTIAVMQRPDARAGQVVLGQRADERVDVVDVAEELLAASAWIAGSELISAKLVTARQAVVAAEVVVVGQAVVAAALDVEGGQVEAAGARRAEQVVADAVHQQQVVLLADLRRQPLEDQPDVGRVVLQDVGLKNASRIDRLPTVWSVVVDQQRASR